MQLKQLKDEALLLTLKDFVKEERKLIQQILEYLEEVERRKLFAERGFSSMFSFCTDYLGYTHQEAQVRIQAMRLAKVVPEVKIQIADGTLSLTVAAKVQGSIARENKIKREAKCDKVTVLETKDILERVQNQSVRNSEKLLFEIFPHHIDVVPDKIKTVSESSVRIEMNLNNETHELLKELQALRAHAYPDQDLKHLMSDLCKLGIKKWRPKEDEKSNAVALMTTTVDRASASKEQDDKLTEQVRTETTYLGDKETSKSENYASTNVVSALSKGEPTQSSHIISRYIPSALKRKIWIRDQGQCQYIDHQTGQKCQSRFRVQTDHIQPFALGGRHSEENLRLMCWQHNSISAEKTFGYRGK